MNIVVTGSSGGIGRAVCERFLSLGHTVYGLDLAPAALTQRAAYSPAAGPAAHESDSSRARPPSSGRTGNRLNAQSTRLAPVKAGHGFPAAAQSRAARRFAPGPASTHDNSCP